MPNAREQRPEYGPHRAGAGDALLSETLARQVPPNEACRALVQLALERGGRDSITVFVIDFGPAGRHGEFRMGPALLSSVRLLLAATMSLGGMVRDEETGKPLAGAIVTLPDAGRTVTTDAGGQYHLLQPPEGTHTLIVRHVGYAPRTLQVRMPPGGNLEISVSLRPQPIRLPAVEVHGRVPLHGAEFADGSAFPDRGSSMAEVDRDPLLSEPDVLQALGGGEVVLRPESPSGVHVRGGASDQVAYLLDGIPVHSPYHAGGLFSAWNPDALARLDLASASPSPADPPTLSGAIAAVTRTPGARFRTLGGLSSTHARLTLDGPLGYGGAGYLISVRSGFPDGIAPQNEATYLRGETGDWLAKVEAPLFGGQIRSLGYGSNNEVDTAVSSGVASDPSALASRNAFEWHSRSLGAEWSRVTANHTWQLRGWSASSHASSAWSAPTAGLDMSATRRDDGLLAAVERRTPEAATVAGIRLERSASTYRIDSDSAAVADWGVGGRTLLTAPFAQHTRDLGHGLETKLAASLVAAVGTVHWEPRLQLRWQRTARLAFSGSYARRHQFAQSLRNTESVVGNIFPADLYLGAGAAGVPVARSDQGVIAADYRPRPGVHVGAQAYARAFDRLLLVAPGTSEPFGTGSFHIGSGISRGVSIDAAVSRVRYGVIASYGLQRVRFETAGSSYVPEHGAKHLFHSGLIVFPTATTSVRLGLSGALGRRATELAGGLEWESCNLLDRGCEFGGSPRARSDALGATALPAYLRLDLGLRKTWWVRMAGRDGSLALFGTVTNLLGRKNVLTYAVDSAGRWVAVEMRPRAPLVAGLDWRF